MTPINGWLEQAIPQASENTIGLRLPKDLKLGFWTLNVVLQTTSCRGPDQSIGQWEDGAGLVLQDNGRNATLSTRWGILGTFDATGVGRHRAGAVVAQRFIGLEEALYEGPQILGFVQKEGKLSIYRNGALVSTGDAFSNSMTTFAWINGWLDSRVVGAGQIAELKLYRQAFDAATMKLLHDKLDCRWHVTDAGPEYRDCSMAQGPAPSSARLPGPAHTTVGFSADIWDLDDKGEDEERPDGTLIPQGGFAHQRDGELAHHLLELGADNRLQFLYYVNAGGEPYALAQQPTSWELVDTPGATLMSWTDLEPLVGLFPEGSVTPGMWALFANGDATVRAVFAGPGEPELPYVLPGRNPVFKLTGLARPVPAVIPNSTPGRVDLDFTVKPALQLTVDSDMSLLAPAVDNVLTGPSWNVSEFHVADLGTCSLPFPTGEGGLRWTIDWTFSTEDPLTLSTGTTTADKTLAYTTQTGETVVLSPSSTGVDCVPFLGNMFGSTNDYISIGAFHSVKYIGGTTEQLLGHDAGPDIPTLNGVID